MLKGLDYNKFRATMNKIDDKKVTRLINTKESNSTCVRSFVNVECGLLRESLEAHVALVGALAGVRAVVDLEVLLACEGRGARQALEGPPLHCGRHYHLIS